MKRNKKKIESTVHNSDNYKPEASTIKVLSEDIRYSLFC